MYLQHDAKRLAEHHPDLKKLHCLRNVFVIVLTNKYSVIGILIP